MTYTHHTKLDLVEGGNIFKQGDHPTLKFIGYDSLGNEVDLTGKQIDGALFSRNKGIIYEAPASFIDGRFVFTIDELLDNGKFQLEFTVTDSADPNYRAKFPSDEYAAELTIKPSKDNMDFVGVSMTTVAQLKGELQGLQTEFAGQVLPRVDIVEDKQTQLEADYQAAVGALTEDSEVILARKGEPTLRAFNDKVVAQLAETKKYLSTNSEVVINLDLSNLKSEYPLNPLNLPVYTGDEAVHPSVLYFKNKFNGYNYWMAVTPYENTDSKTENPSVFCSDDGINWYVPDGGLNPIVNAPENPAGYYSDVNLFMGNDNETMYLMYRQSWVSPGEQLFLTSSKDGVNWSERYITLQSDININRPVSPVIRWNGEKYLMWYVDMISSPKKVYVRSSDDLITWSEKAEVFLQLPENRHPWHLDVIYYNGVYFMILQDNEGSSNPGYLYFGQSQNGYDFKINQSPVLTGVPNTWYSSMYKSSIVPELDNYGLKFILWFSSNGVQGWKVGKTTVNINPLTVDSLKEENDLKFKVLYAVNNIDGYLFADTFDRSDGVLGIASSGQSWVNQTLNFVIENGVTHPETDNNTRAHVELNQSDIEFSARIFKQTITNQGYLTGRFLDGANYIRYGLTNGGYLVLEKIESGVLQQLQTSAVYPKNGDRLTIKFKGNLIECYLNDVEIFNFESSFNLNQTKFGVQANNTKFLFDNIIGKSV